MNELMISDIAIRRDTDGRYCINDLHRAAGGEAKHQPALWLRSAQVQDLTNELKHSTNSQTETNQPLRVQNGGNAPGTYVCKELVYAYAMWISPAFHLKVIRAYDAQVPQPAAQTINMRDPRQLQVAMLQLIEVTQEQQVTIDQQQLQIEQDKPKVQALERISAAKHTITLTETAKVLQVKMVDLTARMHASNWIYRLNGSWVGYDYRIKNGDLAYKEARYTDQDTGKEVIKPYIHVTQQGLVKLAKLFAVEHEVTLA